MPRASRSEWEKRVQRWKDSGLSAKEFAAETGLNAVTLANWRWKLSEGGCAAVENTEAQPDAQAQRSGVDGRFVEMSLVAPAEVPAPLELVLSRGIRVRVHAGFDDVTLARLVRAVEAAR
jgi:transposase